MPGSLILIDSDTASSSSSISLTGMSSTYDVYVATIENLTHSAAAYDYVRFTVSGSADTSSSYDRAYKNLRADTSFGDITSTNQTSIDLGTTGTASNESMNLTQYLFNFHNASEYSFISS